MIKKNCPYKNTGRQSNKNRITTVAVREKGKWKCIMVEKQIGKGTYISKNNKVCYRIRLAKFN